MHLLQPVAYPLSQGHAWPCRVLLDAFCLWEPALILKKLRVCLLHEWLAKPLQNPRTKLIDKFQPRREDDPREEQPTGNTVASSSWYNPGSDRLATQQSKCRLFCLHDRMLSWHDPRMSTLQATSRQSCTPFLLALIIYDLYFWIQESSTHLYYKTILHYPWLRELGGGFMVGGLEF